MSKLSYLAASTPELQAYLIGHENDDSKVLTLKHRYIHGVPAAIVADQLSGRQKARLKLPTFYKMPGIVYPPSINLEQSSSELTARFKAYILTNSPGPTNRIADLTGGFGVDSLFLSQIGEELDYVEPDGDLLEIARHNLSLLGATNIRFHHCTAEDFLKRRQKFDLLYVDPSRRSQSKKVFRLSESQPNVVSLRAEWQTVARHMLVKASPLLDLHQGISELKTVDTVYIVATDNECKEVLLLCSEKGMDDPPVIAVNLRPAGHQELRFRFSEEKNSPSNFHDPLTFLYEPHPWILKAGAFKTIGARYEIFKLQVNTHLYTSDQQIEDFPGRVFRIEQSLPDAKQMKICFPEGKANVFTRNYPLRPEELRKKFKLRDGGEKYLIGFSGVRKKFLVAAVRVL